MVCGFSNLPNVYVNVYWWQPFKKVSPYLKRQRAGRGGTDPEESIRE